MHSVAYGALVVSCGWIVIINRYIVRNKRIRVTTYSLTPLCSGIEHMMRVFSVRIRIRDRMRHVVGAVLLVCLQVSMST